MKGCAAFTLVKQRRLAARKAVENGATSVISQGSNRNHLTGSRRMPDHEELYQKEGIQTRKAANEVSMTIELVWPPTLSC